MNKKLILVGYMAAVIGGRTEASATEIKYPIVFPVQKVYPMSSFICDVVRGEEGRGRRVEPLRAEIPNQQVHVKIVSDHIEKLKQYREAIEQGRKIEIGIHSLYEVMMDTLAIVRVARTSEELCGRATQTALEIEKPRSEWSRVVESDPKAASAIASEWDEKSLPKYIEILEEYLQHIKIVQSPAQELE